MAETDEAQWQRAGRRLMEAYETREHRERQEYEHLMEIHGTCLPRNGAAGRMTNRPVTTDAAARRRHQRTQTRRGAVETRADSQHYGPGASTGMAWQHFTSDATEAWSRRSIIGDRTWNWAVNHHTTSVASSRSAPYGLATPVGDALHPPKQAYAFGANYIC